MTDYDLRAAEGMQYPGDFGTQYLIVNDPADPLANPEYAGETDSLALALLFAAAPDLLNACVSGWQWISAHLESMPVTSNADYEVLFGLREAIKKAKGESGD